MTRWLSLFAALFLSFSVIGCGPDAGTPGDENDPSAVSDEEQDNPELEDAAMSDEGGDGEDDGGGEE
jgi:hypothetical protein